MSDNIQGTVMHNVDKSTRRYSCDSEIMDPCRCSEKSSQNIGRGANSSGSGLESSVKSIEKRQAFSTSNASAAKKKKKKACKLVGIKIRLKEDTYKG